MSTHLDIEVKDDSYLMDLPHLRFNTAYQGMRHTLITGPSGSGKTYLSDALKRQGIDAWDADAVSGLTGWFDGAGNRVAFPPDAGKFFLDNHAFLWNRLALADFLGMHRVVYLFGISRNALDMMDLFHKAYFLKTPPEVLAERLRSADRANPMGRTAYQVEYSLTWARINEEKAKKLGISMIDATQPVERILLHIVEGMAL